MLGITLLSTAVWLLFNGYNKLTRNRSLLYCASDKDSFQLIVPMEYSRSFGTKSIRLFDFLGESFQEHPRKLLRSLCADQLILVNNIPRPPEYFLESGDVVSFDVGKSTLVPFALAENVTLDVLYADENILAINKPSGMVVHPAPGIANGTFVNALLSYLNMTDSISFFHSSNASVSSNSLSKSSFDATQLIRGSKGTAVRIDGNSSKCNIIDSNHLNDSITTSTTNGSTQPRSSRFVNALRQRQTTPLALMPGIVHRLDSGTSGVLLATKNPQSAELMKRKFARREVHKAYIALCFGNPGDVTVDLPIGPAMDEDDFKMQTYPPLSAGKHAVSHIKTLAVNKHMSLVLVVIETGRTHQIRVHLQSLGTPVVGDKVYGHGKLNKLADLLVGGDGRTMLHSYRTQFMHPVSGARTDIIAPLPPVMERLIRLLCDDNEGQPYIDILGAVHKLTDNIFSLAE